MIYSPLITITTAPASIADHWAVWSVLITQAVTLLVFGLSAHQARKSDRDKRARDTKRDVLLEVAPAIQRVYAGLAELTNPSTRIDDWNTRMAVANGAVAKLTAVASDETIEAGRKLMTAMATVMLRMLGKRVEVGTDLEGHKQLIAFWRQETAVIPDLLADLSTKARSEIPLPLDKKIFADGLKNSNEVLFGELERLLLALSQQQAGKGRDSQSGQPPEQTVGRPPVVTMDSAPDPGAHLSPEQVKALSAQMIELQQQAAFWEYTHLNRFFVHRTQLVLNWLIDRQSKGDSTSIGYFDAEQTARVVSPGERETIIKALLAHRLITADNGMLVVTPKGLDYAQWRGPIPQMAATS